MSGYFPGVACEGCGQVINAAEIAGRWFWGFTGSRVCPMDHQLGYCRNCAGLSVVGLAPPDRGRRDFAWLAWQLAHRDSWMRNLWPDFPQVTLDLSRRFEIRRRHRGLCLFCGGTDVSVIRFPRRFPSRGDACRDTGIRHRGCGGRIVRKGAGYTRTWPIVEWRIFDPDGNLTFGEPLRRPDAPSPFVQMSVADMLAAANPPAPA